MARYGQLISVRLEAHDLRSLDKEAKERDHSRTYVVRCLVRAFIAGTNVSPHIQDELRLLREELRRIGVNLNQAVKLANSERRATRGMFEQVGTTARAVAKVIGTLGRVEVKPS